MNLSDVNEEMIDKACDTDDGQGHFVLVARCPKDKHFYSPKNGQLLQ